jgi:hypothetical protein
MKGLGMPKALALIAAGLIAFLACSREPKVEASGGDSPFLHLQAGYGLKIQGYGKTEYAAVHKTEGVQACRERDFDWRAKKCHGTLVTFPMNRSQDPAKREFTLHSLSLKTRLKGLFNIKSRIKRFFRRGQPAAELGYPRWFQVSTRDATYRLYLKGADDVLTCVPTLDLYSSFLDRVRGGGDCGSVQATQKYLDRLKMLGGNAPLDLNEYELHVKLAECKYADADLGPSEDIIVNVGRTIPKSLFATRGMKFVKTDFTAENISKIAYASDLALVKLWCNYNNNLRKKEQELAFRGKIRRVKNGVTDDCGIQREFGKRRGRPEPYFIVIPKLKSLLKAEKEDFFATWNMEILDAAPEEIAYLSDLQPAMQAAKKAGTAAIQFQVPAGVTSLRRVADAFVKHGNPYRTRQDTVTSNTVAILLQHLNAQYGLLPKQDTLNGSEEIIIPTNNDFIEQVDASGDGVIFVGKIREIPR